jgi:hypothetical protein
VQPAWTAEIGGRLSPPVVAGGKLFVSAVDAHTVHALDREDGTPLWAFTAGARVDSPPTIHEGLVLFGSADGWVYALSASDGELAWRLRAAPEDRNIVAFGRLESAWPVHGSVLVNDGVAHFTAGRSSYLDGGIYVYSADPVRGEIFSSRSICSPDPVTGLQPPQSSPQEMPGALSDILVGSARGVTMRHLRIDGDGADFRPGHLLSTAGFLDDSWFNRTNWSLRGTAGQLLAFDDAVVCGVRAYSGTGRSGFFFPGKGYELFAADRGGPERAKQDKPGGRWRVRVPIRVRAMVLAGQRLFIAGPPDAADPDDPWAAMEGRKGGLLRVVSAANGERLHELPLDAIPVFDGMAAAGGRLYLSGADGRLTCFGSRNR